MKCDFVKTVLEDNKSLKPAKSKLCFERCFFFSLKRVSRTITKLDNDILSIVEEICKV